MQNIHTQGQFSTKICSHSVITPINNLICTQKVSHIHTGQVGGFLYSQIRGGGLSSGSSERSKRYCLKLYPVACQGNSCLLKLALTCVSRSNARLTSCFWLRVCYTPTRLREKERINLQSFSLLLVRFGQVTLCDPLGGLSIRKREGVFFLGGVL